MEGSESLALHEKVHGLIDDGIKQVVVNLTEARWSNSSGLGILSASITTLRNIGGDLKLANVKQKIESLLRSTKLLDVFETYESVDEAVASFGK